jgi:putative ABC transport system permease protein
MISSVLQDVRFALRQFRQYPGFTLAAVLILALGLGANTAIFSLVNVFLLRPLPYKQPGRLVALFERTVVGNEGYVSVAPGNFLDWQKFSKSFENLTAYSTGAFNLSSATNAFEPERIDGCGCSGNLFTTLGVAPILGRGFRPDEDRYGAPRVAVISYSLWQQRFGGSPDVLGQRIRLDADDYQIIGVMPQRFAFPYSHVQVWTPLLVFLSPEQQIRHDLHFLQVIGRLRPGISVAQAKAEVDAIAARYKHAHPDEATGAGANVVPLEKYLASDARTPLLVLLGAVLCVLLIACVNIANLLLSRAVARNRELAVRAAIGASRARLVRQLLTESVLIAMAGGAAGLGIALLLSEVLAAHAPGAEAILPTGSVPVDPLVFLFAFIVALLTGIAAGLFPAIQSSRRDVARGLTETSRSSTLSPAHGRFRSALVTVEVALSLMLLVAAGLLLRSFYRLYAVHPGARVDHTLTMTISLPDKTYKNPAQWSAFFTQLGEKMQHLPGVLSAGITSCAPVSGGCNTLFFYIEGRPVTPGHVLAALERAVDPPIFAAGGVPLLRGRNFTPQDGVGFDEKHPRLGSIVISESMAKTFFPNEDPIGKRIYFDFEAEKAKFQGTPVPRYQIIGIVGDVLPALDSPVQPTLYRPLLDGTYSGGTILLHTAIEPHSVFGAAQNAIHELDPALAVYDVRTMEEIVGRSVSDREFSMLLFGAFALLAVMLACVGLYGVLSYAVAQRRGEIGIRMALGARHADVNRLMLREGMKPAVLGIVLGFAGALLTCRVLQSLLFGIGPLDPLTFALVPPLLLAVAVLSCYLPALRATRIDPMIALRVE